MNSSEKSHERYSPTSYIQALEDEHKKIQAFQKELPLCFHLITQAIDVVRQQTNGDDKERTLKPTLEEFLPLKPSSPDLKNCREDKKISSETDKPDWLRSVQLWNQEPESAATKLNGPTRPIAVNAKKNGRAFGLFDKEKQDSVADCATRCDKYEADEKKREAQVQTHRKVRRCWSTELHRRFLQALKQLGGPQVATPKQIRELMDVNGLTNDEIKSHLQKYRLHSKRPSSAVQNSENVSPTTPQIVIVDGIWVPSQFPSQKEFQHYCINRRRLKEEEEEEQCHYNKKCWQKSPTCPLQSEEDANNSNSPTLSSSSQTTTLSPVLNVN